MLTKARRTHTCGALGAQDIGSRVVLQGWADGVRNLGGVTFVDLRDRHGVTQVTIDERSPEETRAVGAQAHLEYVLEVEGTVVARANPNPRIPTGAIELIAERATILSRTPALPFAIREEPNTSEETRLRYRYLDLRRTQIQKNLVIRHRMALATRRYLDSEGFIEVETPILTKATPEGARDYLVPSRVHPGHWYALPQSPQIFKQILMIAGMDRYFQIVKCFRDEDLRADRQPEFTQIDLELSFATRELVMEVAEGVARTLWREVLGYEIPPIERLSYADSIARFGLDAPDLRFGMELFDLTDALRETGFALIGGALAQGGICKGLCVQGAAEDTSRKVIDNWSAWVKRYKLGGVLWGKLGADGWSGAIAKLSPQEQASVAEISGAKLGDLLILGVGPASAVNPGLGRLRVQIANERKLIPAGFRFCWITDFPAFEWDDQEQRWSAVHHPFTSPRPAHIPLLGTGREGEILADAYDIVCNGYEIGGGSIRIHEPEVQRKVFTALGMSAETVASKFGYLIEALQYGAPPHGGLAFGFDRCAMLLCGTDNIREVIAFPKTTAAQDLMSDAPSGVDPRQLVELHVRNVTE